MGGIGRVAPPVVDLAHRVANHGFLRFRSCVALFGNNLSHRVFSF
jgi:hypothetical protein